MALIHVNFASEALGMDVAADVILPQFSSRLIGMETAARESHPVLWLLHGASDNHTIWLRRTSIERYAAPYGLAVVMPSAHLSRYADMAHSSNRGRYFTFISQELPEQMRHLFPKLSTRREDNFIAGLSMGGMGSLSIGLACPEQYEAIGCFSAGNPASRKQLVAGTEQRQRNVYGDIVELSGTKYDAEWLAKQAIDGKKKLPRIYHGIGSEDFLLDMAHRTRDYFESLAGNPFGYEYHERPGAHTWEFWDVEIQQFLKFIGLTSVKGVTN